MGWTHKHPISLPDDATGEQTTHHCPDFRDGVDFVNAELCHLLFQILLLVEIFGNSVKELSEQVQSSSRDTRDQEDWTDAKESDLS